MVERKKILWLVSWYPNRNNPFDGDFIQRHAKAAAIYNDIHVLFVTESKQTDAVEVEIKRYTGLTEEIVYIKKRMGPTGRLLKQYLWFNENKKAINRYINTNGTPSFVHVHIPWKAGLIGLWMKKKYNLSYLLTEHWGMYNDAIADNFNSKPVYFKQVVKKIFDESSLSISVSEFLAKEIKNRVTNKNFAIISNVVDTSIFYPKDKKESRFSFIHVSNMVELKNVSGILNAFKKLVSEYNFDVQLIMVGNTDDKYIIEAEKHDLLNKKVFFKGELTYNEVAVQMQLSHCLILNSTIENAPCVISEALCCGIPVIAPRVGGIPEMIDNSNGILIDPGTENLFLAMEKIIRDYTMYNTNVISEGARQKYSYSRISTEFSALYSLTNIVKGP